MPGGAAAGVGGGAGEAAVSDLCCAAIWLGVVLLLSIAAVPVFARWIRK